MATKRLLRIGTSGWQYDHWQGLFYPPGLTRRAWFDHYAAHFDTVEINNTFYRLPAPAVFEDWRERAPAGFLYAVKVSRFATHLKHLLDPESTLGLFAARAELLGPHLGPVLVQLPPRWAPDPGRLSAFLDAAPRSWRFTVEVRDPRWLVPEVYSVLVDHGAALCIHDRIDRHPRELTTDWTYVRFHGGRRDGGYEPQALSAWASWIAARLADGIAVYAYFNNDLGGHAIRDAEALRRYLAARSQAA